VAGCVLPSHPATVQVGLVSPEISDELNSDWSVDVEDVLDPDSDSPRRPQLQVINYYFSAPTSVDRAIGESVGGDILLVAVAFIVICLFTIIALFVRHKVYNRGSLALLGIFTVGLSIAAGFGLSLYLSIPFTSLSQVCAADVSHACCLI
jgi:hypothetical protein